jgi:hypothetical protein
MNQNANATATTADAARKTCATLLDTLADLGSSWAAYGLKVGKMALETSAETLGKTAHTLDVLAAELDKKVKAAAPAEKPETAPHADAAPADAAPQA